MAPKKTKTKVEARSESQNVAVQERVAGVSVESALRNVGTAQATIGRTLANVGEQLQKELQTLDDVKKAVEITRGELEALHGKDSLLQSIEQLEMSRNEMEANLDRDRAAAIQALETEKAEFRRSADADAANYSHEMAKAQLAKQSALEAEIHAAQITERNRKELLEKSWAAREEGIRATESEFLELKKQVAAFPDKLRNETNIARNEGIGSVKREFEHQAALSKNISENAANMAALRIATLDEQVTRLTEQLNDANKRVTEANAKVAEIATKALESASGERAVTQAQTMLSNGNGAARKA